MPVTEYTYNSPDWTHRVRLIFAGDVRFGPPCFRVALDGRVLRTWWLKPRLFGECCVWSPESRYLALQEWRQMAESPEIEVKVIDLASRREVSVVRHLGKWVEPVRFDGEALVCTVISTDKEGKRVQDEERLQFNVI